MQDSEMMFLETSYNNDLLNYEELLEKNNKYTWDAVIITASNERQKQSYELQIEYRRKMKSY